MFVRVWDRPENERASSARSGGRRRDTEGWRWRSDLSLEMSGRRGNNGKEARGAFVHRTCYSSDHLSPLPPSRTTRPTPSATFICRPHRSYPLPFSPSLPLCMRAMGDANMSVCFTTFFYQFYPCFVFGFIFMLISLTSAWYPEPPYSPRVGREAKLPSYPFPIPSHLRW